MAASRRLPPRQGASRNCELDDGRLTAVTMLVGLLHHAGA